MAHSTTFRNVRHERFARALAEGKSQVAAYRDAGYAGKAAEQNASSIAKNPGVQARVAELLQEKADIAVKAMTCAVQELAITKSDILRELHDNAINAKADHTSGGYSASNRALELLGKELGMFIERRETGKPGEFEQLADAELDAAIAAELAIIRARENAGEAPPPDVPH